jgi:hypothetical protein
MNITATSQSAIQILASLIATSVDAQTPLPDAFSACEASVVEGSDGPRRAIGKLIDEDENGSRIRLDTPKGTVVAMFLPPTRPISACLLWGRHPELAVEFQELWQDWVEGEEAADASDVWFNSALENSSNIDLTDNNHAGYVVARCNTLDSGLVLSSQPVVANSMRQVLPEPDIKLKPTMIYQFSAITALPGRCPVAVEAHKVQN